MDDSKEYRRDCLKEVEKMFDIESEYYIFFYKSFRTMCKAELLFLEKGRKCWGIDLKDLMLDFKDELKKINKFITEINLKYDTKETKIQLCELYGKKGCIIVYRKLLLENFSHNDFVTEEWEKFQFEKLEEFSETMIEKNS